MLNMPEDSYMSNTIMDIYSIDDLLCSSSMGQDKYQHKHM